MSYKLNVGDQLDLGMSAGVGSDYTYTNSARTRVSIDANGIVTALAPGFLAVTITRNSDNNIVDRVVIWIRPSNDSSPGDPEATLVPLNLVGWNIGGYDSRGYGDGG